MSKKVFNMQGGKHSAAAYTELEKWMHGSIVANAASFVVSAGTGMLVNISTGAGLITDTIARRIGTDAVETATVPTASASFNRIDTVVAYIDTGVTPTTAVTDNTNDILKFAVVAGTAASTPVAPTGAAIISAIGAGKPYMVLYDVLVPQNATNTSGMTFTDRRVLPTAQAIADAIVTAGKLATSAVTTAKIAPNAVTAAKIEAQQAWITPSLINGWVNYGSGFETFAYMKDSLGFVHVKGVIKSGTTTAATPIFNLPAGYRPAGSMYLPTVNGGSNTFGVIELQSGGNILIIIGSASYTMLGHIVFKADN